MLTVKTPEEVYALLSDTFAQGPLGVEELPLEQATGRVLSAPVTAQEFVPGFDRSTVDGYAVRASDTFGCSDSLPALLTLQGEILMGEGASIPLSSEECAAVPTGGAIPPGADAATTTRSI